MTDRHERLRSAHLYLVCDDEPDDFLASALGAGVDIVQLRMKEATDDAIVAAGRRFAAAAAEHGALFILNDRPDLVAAAGADGVHVGQDDTAVADARATVGPERLVGLSTHSPEQVDAAANVSVDYIGVGPVHATPTKPGTTGGRPRARPLRGGARDRPVLRDRRHRAGERRCSARCGGRRGSRSSVR